MSDDLGSTSTPNGMTSDPDDDRDLPLERLDNDFDVASAREQRHEQARAARAADDQSETD